jgi:hypothetical protein
MRICISKMAECIINLLEMNSNIYLLYTKCNKENWWKGFEKSWISLWNVRNANFTAISLEATILKTSQKSSFSDIFGRFFVYYLNSNLRQANMKCWSKRRNDICQKLPYYRKLTMHYRVYKKSRPFQIIHSLLYYFDCSHCFKLMHA